MVTLSSSIRLVTDGTTVLDAAALAGLPTRERTIEVVCASGDRETGTWRGVAVADLLDLATVPPETTHLVVTADDGYRVCLPIRAALEGLIAFERDGRSLAAVDDHESRFVAPGVEGPRTVKDVARIETEAIEPGDDPERYEDLWPES